MKLVFATANEHKAAEVAQMMPHWVELLNLKDINYTEPIAETGSTFSENALIKAQAVYDACGIPVIADDSGLEVKALSGAPGVYSARFAGETASDKDNVVKLLTDTQSATDRSAAFRTVICLKTQAGEWYFEGKINGQITLEPIGDNGFGYDPVFIPEGEERTFAQMSASEKNSMSHRKRALEQFIDFIASGGLQ